VTDSNNVERNQFDSTENIYVKYIIENLSDDTVEYKYACSDLNYAVDFLVYRYEEGVFIEIIGGVPPSSFIYTANLLPHTNRIWQKVIKLESGKYRATCSGNFSFEWEKYTFIENGSGGVIIEVG